MDKSTFVFGIIITAWLAFSFDLIAERAASQIILIMFIVFTLIQVGIIKED